MNIWQKMITALQGGANELGETIIDGQALRILDQEVREASEELLSSKHSLASIIAKHKLSLQREEELKEHIALNEGYAIQALDKKEEQLALEVAQKIAELENELKEQGLQSKGLEGNIAQLKEAVKSAEQNIKRLKQQVDTIRATENVQRAQAAMAQRSISGNPSKLRTAMDSLEAIKTKQREHAAHLQAAAEIANQENGDPLLEKLAKAGIVTADKDAQEVLDRLRKSKK